MAYKKIEYFTQAIQLNPNLADAYEKRALHYYFQRKFDKAIQDYTKVIDLKPREINAYLMRGISYFKKEKGSGIRAEINNLTINLAKKKTREFSELLERSIRDLSYAIELNPELATAYSYRAEAFRLKGMTEPAMRDATMAIHLHRDDKSIARAYRTRAKIYRKLGQIDLSEDNFRQSVKFDPYVPDFPPLHVPIINPYISNTSNLKRIGSMGLLGIVIIAFVLIFKLTLPVPKKK
jgi:tetratricopeptide (TPR) repeat protein